jgi:hypothetical protein
MITPSIRKLQEARTSIAQLEQALAYELASLPASYGFDSVDAFVIAIETAHGKGRPGRRSTPAASKIRRRAKITDAIRAKVKALTKAGKTGSHIAKAVGISLPSVQNIKKVLGLVKSRKKPPSKPKVKRAPAKRKAAPKIARKPMPRVRVAPKKAPKTAVAAPKPSPEASAEATPAPSA